MATCKVDINSGRKVLEAQSGTVLVDLLASQGIFLPSACGSLGKCGLCRVIVEKGLTSFTDAENRLLSEMEKSSGYHLACQSRITTDMNITLPQEFLGAQDFLSVVRSKKMLTHDIVELTLSIRSHPEINFNAGQYITLKMPATADAKAAMRPFSIASSNLDRQFIQLNIRLNPQGTVTPWIFNTLKEGDVVSFSGPRGVFFMRNTMNPAVFIAGGSGMAPLRSILKTMSAHESQRKILYFFGALTQNDLFYLDEMKQYERMLPNFRFIPALSNEPSDSSWEGERGLVTEVMDRVCKEQLTGYEAYLCGKPAMIEGCTSALEKKGIDRSQVFFDLFNSPKPVK